MFILRVLSNNRLPAMNVLTFASVLSKGRRAVSSIANVKVVSRLLTGAFSYGMFGFRHIQDGGRRQRNGRGGKGECAELTFCRQGGICYKFNRLTCRYSDNCGLGLHICKRCWAVDGSEKRHASDDMAKCPNMSKDYMNVLIDNGAGDAVLESEQDNQDERIQSARGGGGGGVNLSRGQNPRGQTPSYNPPTQVDQDDELQSSRGGGVYQSRGQNSSHNQPTQPSGRGGTSQVGQLWHLRDDSIRHSGRSSRQGGHVQSSQQSQRRGSSTSIQPLDLTAAGPHSHHPTVTSPEASPDRINTDDSASTLALREEIVNLKTQIITTKSDLGDEKYQHQMLQVKYAELEKKCSNLAQENSKLKINRQMQRLFPVFNSPTQYENEEIGMGQNTFNMDGRSRENEGNETSGESNFNLFGSQEREHFFE